MLNTLLRTVGAFFNPIHAEVDAGQRKRKRKRELKEEDEYEGSSKSKSLVMSPPLSVLDTKPPAPLAAV